MGELHCVGQPLRRPQGSLPPGAQNPSIPPSHGLHDEFCYLLLTNGIWQGWWNVTWENTWDKDCGIWAEVIRKLWLPYWEVQAPLFLSVSYCSLPGRPSALVRDSLVEWDSGCQQPEGAYTWILPAPVKTSHQTAASDSSHVRDHPPEAQLRRMLTTDS